MTSFLWAQTAISVGNALYLRGLHKTNTLFCSIIHTDRKTLGKHFGFFSPPFLYWCFWWRSGVMCSRSNTFVSSSACGKTESPFLIETSGVWELTEWSSSHHHLSAAHYCGPLSTTFSDHQCESIKSFFVMVWELRHHYLKPLFRWNLKAARLPSHISPGHICDLWGILVSFDDSCLWSAHAPRSREDRVGTQLCGIVRRQAASTTPAGRQQIWTPWHYANGGVWLVLTRLHTTLFISIIRYSNGSWVRSM